RLFEPALGHELHSHADAEKGTPLADGRLLDSLGEARNDIETGAAVRIGADPGKHDAVRSADSFGIVRQIDLSGNPSLRRRPLERPRDGALIARAVADDSDAHRPLRGESIRPKARPRVLILPAETGLPALNAGGTADGCAAGASSPASAALRNSA